MDALFHTRRSRPTAQLPAAKRLSTPAGDRLSVILENGDASFAPRKSPRSSHQWSKKSGSLAGTTLFEDPEDAYDQPPDRNAEKLEQLRNNKHIAKRGGWKRLALCIAVSVVVVVAVVVGVVVGLKKRSPSTYVFYHPGRGVQNTDWKQQCSSSSTGVFCSIWCHPNDR